MDDVHIKRWLRVGVNTCMLRVDTQWDMFLALCGSVLAQLLLARLHDRQLGVPR